MHNPKKEKLESSVNSHDYFIDMAAIIDILIQETQYATKVMIESQKDHTKRLKNIEKDLMLLQELYKIIRKS